MKLSIFICVLLILLLSAVSYASSHLDADEDEVPDAKDECPNTDTSTSVKVDQSGCSCSQKTSINCESLYDERQCCVPDDNPCTDDCGIDEVDDIGRVSCNVEDDTNTCPRGVCERGECKASPPQIDTHISQVVVRGGTPTSYRGDCPCEYKRHADHIECLPCPPAPSPFPSRCPLGIDPITGMCKGDPNDPEEPEYDSGALTSGSLKDIVDYLNKNLNSECGKLLGMGFGHMSTSQRENFFGKIDYVTAYRNSNMMNICKDLEGQGQSISTLFPGTIYVCPSWIQQIREGKIYEKEKEFLIAIANVNGLNPSSSKIDDMCFGFELRGGNPKEYKAPCRFNERDAFGLCENARTVPPPQNADQIVNHAREDAINALDKYPKCLKFIDGGHGDPRELLRNIEFQYDTNLFELLENVQENVHILSADLAMVQRPNGPIILFLPFWEESESDQVSILLHEIYHFSHDTLEHNIDFDAFINKYCFENKPSSLSPATYLSPSSFLSSSPFCTDSDGNSYETAGTIQSNSNSAQDCCTNGNNECLSESAYVKEYFCDNNEISYEIHECNGACSDGRCVVQYSNPASPTLTVTPTKIDDEDSVTFHVSSESPNSEVLVYSTDSTYTVMHDNQLLGYTDQNGDFAVTINQDDASSWQPDNYKFEVIVNEASSNEVAVEVQTHPVTECDLNCPGPNGWAYWGPPYTGGCGECGTVLRWCDENCQHTEQYTCVDEGCP